MKDETDLQRGILYSAGIHLTLLILAYVGLPDLFQKEMEPQPMVITLEDLPIREITNVKPSPDPVSKPQKEQPKPIEKPKPPAAPPKPPAPKPTPKPQPPAPAPKTEQKPAPQPDPKPKEKQEEKKPEKEPEPEKKPEEQPQPVKEEETLDTILKDIENNAANNKPDENKPIKENVPASNPTRSEAPYDPTLPLSLSERDAITSQFVKCWRLPAGSANDYSLKVTVDVWMNQDGSVNRMQLEATQKGRYMSDPVFKAAADGALRAVKQCSPLKNLSTDKYGSWKEMRLHFDPRFALQ